MVMHAIAQACGDPAAAGRPDRTHRPGDRAAAGGLAASLPLAGIFDNAENPARYAHTCPQAPAM